jgi:predicted RNA-binding protein YlxR (DUF448 family)
VPSIPTRTCVGCRARCPRTDLVRVVLDPSVPRTLVFDAAAHLPGRGAWLHPTPVCLERALRRGVFQRALRVGAALDTGALEAFAQDRTGTRPENRPTKERVESTMDTP